MKKNLIRWGALTVLSSLAFAPSLTACGSSRGSGVEQVARGMAAMNVVIPNAKPTPGSVQRITVTISGAGISPSISADLIQAPNGYSGTIAGIPAGASRTFHVEATDILGTVLLAGDATGVTITPGNTALVSLVLEDATAPVPFQNTAPQITALSASSGSAAPGGTISLGVTATDADGDALTYAWSATGGTFDDATKATPVWTAPSVSSGPQTLSVEVSDPHGAKDGISITIAADAPDAGSTGSATVEASVNHWPSVTNVLASPTRLGVGDVTQLDVTALDVEADALSYGWTSTCAGTFDNASQQRPAFTLSGLSPSGSCAFTVLVTDARGGHGSGTLGIHTGDAPPVSIGDGGTDAATFCTPNAATCNGNTLTVCAADGSATSTVSCPLGCNAGACVVVAPSNLPADTCVMPGTTDLTLTGALTIDTSGTCDQVVVQGNGAPDICVRKYRTVNISGTLTVTGTRAFALVATESFTISGGIDATAKLEVSGPGANAAEVFGIGGAGYATAGAASGAIGGSSAKPPGGGAYGTPAGVPLFGGSRGGRGEGQNVQPTGGAGGGGGGALELVSCGTFNFPDAPSYIEAWGGGGRGGESHSKLSAGSGGGGGSGGTILIEAASFVLAPHAGRPGPVIQAWGAPGGGGGGQNGTGTSGADATGIFGGAAGQANAGTGGDSPLLQGFPTPGTDGTLVSVPAPELTFATGAGGGAGANGVIRLNSLVGTPIDPNLLDAVPNPTVGVVGTH